jgi:HEAT repeat protein
MPRSTPAGGDFDGWVRLLGSDAYRQRARRHLMRSGSAALPALRRGLHHDAPAVRRVCATILDFLLDEDALPDLVGALDDPDPQVLKRALHALACDACKENECRPADELFVPRAIELLDHPEPEVRAGAIDALGKVAQRTGDPGSPAARALAAAVLEDRDAGLRNMARRRLVTATRHG